MFSVGSFKLYHVLLSYSMSATDETTGLDEQRSVSFRCSERLKRKAGMRANQLGMQKSEYIRQLIREDVDNAGIPDLE